jgi:hypothetical protein
MKIKRGVATRIMVSNRPKTLVTIKIVELGPHRKKPKMIATLPRLKVRGNPKKSSRKRELNINIVISSILKLPPSSRF